MNTASLKPSLFTFTWAYAMCVAIIYAVNIFIELPSNSAMGIIAMMAATMPAGGKFFTTYERLPTKGERARFAVMGTAIAMAISAADTSARMPTRPPYGKSPWQKHARSSLRTGIRPRCSPSSFSAFCRPWW